MLSQRSSRSSRPRHHKIASTTTFLATLLAAVILAPGVVHADGDTIPVSAGPEGHGPANTPVIAASFTSSFANVAQGHTLDLAWSHIDAKYEPLSITARAINRTTENRANSFLVTIAPRLYNTSSFSWSLVPFPLLYMSTGLYELEIRPAIWNLSANEPGSLSVPVLARSSYFAIVGQDGSNSNGASAVGSQGDTTGSPSSGDQSGSGQIMSGPANDSSTSTTTTTKGPNRLALGLGLSLGLAGALALSAVLFVARRRHQRNAAEAEKRRQRRFAYMID